MIPSQSHLLDEQLIKIPKRICRFMIGLMILNTVLMKYFIVILLYICVNMFDDSEF
jgi:hypothetical protein